MNAPLAIASVAMLLLAGAVELWWGSAARARRRANLAHLHRQLLRDPDRRLPEPVDDAPEARVSWWTNLLGRAGLAPNGRTGVLLIAPGIVLALLAAWRLGSLWAVAPMFVLYASLVFLWMRFRIEKQQQRMTQQLPDFLDGMVRIVAIGNSLPVAFQSTAATTPPPLRALLDRTLQRMHAGLDLDEALRQSGRLYRLESVELLEAVIAMSMRFGGRTDQALQRMSVFMRDLEQAQLELKAITSETRMSSWVLGLLPLLAGALMMLADPAFFRPMFEQPLGHRLLLVALALEGIGVALLYRLARSL